MPPAATAYTRHYCRACIQEFDATPKTDPSAHARFIAHHYKQHRGLPDPIIVCGKYCSAREQSDEKQHGTRLYGPGSTSLKDLVPLVMTYDQLFPEEEA